MSLVANIKTLCKTKKISLPKLEKELGFGNGAMYNWDKNSPSISKVSKVANYFGVSVDSLIEDGKEINGKEDIKNNLPIPAVGVK
jgi:transcriptional regulator with XRE-family HTH domain